VRLIVRKVKGSFVVERYDDLVAQEEDVKEQLEFLNRLMGESFIVEAAERKVKKGKGSVAFQGLLAIKAAFHPDADNRGHEQISIGEG
jgi:anthranilate/para-aminobenzoate synthase component II